MKKLRRPSLTDEPSGARDLEPHVPLATTLTDESAMAVAAMIGDSRIPEAG
jgi:hypothetical protein